MTILPTIRTQASLEDLLPLMTERLENGGEVKFSPSGNSMRPMLRRQGDQVVLVKPTRPLKKGDVVLYRRTSGQFVLHRIVEVRKPDEFVLCGDAQTSEEYPIYRSQIIGLVRAFYRGNRLYDCSRSRRYWIYCRIWQGTFPIRRVVLGAARLGKRLLIESTRLNIFRRTFRN